MNKTELCEWMPGGHEDWFSIRVNQSQFELKFNKTASTLYQDFHDAASNAASLLYSKWGDKQLFLGLSGGVDSEFTANTFLKNKIPFTPIILKIADWNAIETWYAEYWCHTNNITPIVLEFTVDEFLSQTIKFYPKLNQINDWCQAPILILYEYAKNNGGHCVYSGGDINLDSTCKKFFCYSLDFISNLVDVGDHPTSFFMYTPEMAASYINKFNTDWDEQYNKLSFYNVSPRPKIDYVLSTMTKSAQFQALLNKFNHISKHNIENTRFWYGTKDQILSSLIR